MSFPINFIVANDKPNTLFGMVWADHINALGGNDTIYTGSGDDTIMAGDGNDLVANDRGDDVFWGNKGNDTISFNYLGTTAGGSQPYNHSYGVIFDLAIGTKQFNFGFGLDEYHNFENVDGGGLADILWGTNGANKIDGGDGSDQLFGREGRDTIEGSVGADVIVGGKGGDTLAGFYALTNGGDGQRDTFVYQKVSDSGTTKTTRDIIFGNFGTNAASTDRIDVHQIDANPYVDGNQAFDFIGKKAFSEDDVGEIRVKKLSDGYWQVQFDRDHDNGAEMIINVHSVKAPVEVDFIL